MANHKSQTAVLIISTFPTEGSIVNIAKDFIDKKKLCACISIAKVRSLYCWNSKLEDQEEYIVFFKTTKLRAKKLKDEIKKVHPYQIPEILEIKIDDVSKSYLSWVVETTTASAMTANTMPSK